MTMREPGRSAFLGGVRRAFPWFHRYEPDPRFSAIPTRRCRRCGRVESTAFTGEWRRFPYPEKNDPVRSV